MRYKLVRCRQQVVYDHLVLVILEASIPLHLNRSTCITDLVGKHYLLYAYAMMSDFPKITESFTLFFGVGVLVKEIPLSAHKLGKHEHAWAGAVDSRTLDENLVSCPCIVNPDSRSPILG
jgi:hypothetical protein